MGSGHGLPNVSSFKGNSLCGVYAVLLAYLTTYLLTAVLSLVQGPRCPVTCAHGSTLSKNCLCRDTLGHVVSDMQ
jgi:hypothetical protein